MSIHVRSLLPATYKALTDLCEQRDWAPVYAWMEEGDVAWLWFKLRGMPDDAATFPHGKWATIQHIEALLDDAAHIELNP